LHAKSAFESFLGSGVGLEEGLPVGGVVGAAVAGEVLGFGVGGAFLGLLHYDLPYYLATIVVLVGATVREEDKARAMAAIPSRGRVLPA